MESFNGRLSTAVAVLNYITAGNATITIKSLVTGARYTYKFKKMEPKRGQVLTPVQAKSYFVKLLTGQDNENNFTYMGMVLNGELGPQFRFTPASKISRNSTSVIALDYLLSILHAGELHTEKMEVWHTGRCGRCGRLLTVPESVATGFGPECAGKVGI